MTTNRQFSLALEALASLKLGTDSNEANPSQPVPTAPALNRVLSEVGPLPREALFLGIASDGLPVLLNLHNPNPGPMLVIGDAGSGKTAFLQSVARSVTLTHTEKDVQFGVVTAHVEEWEDVARTNHRVGVFDVAQSGAQEFVQSLASWAHSNRNTDQSVLILVDDLEAIAKMDIDVLNHFRWLLLRGPARRVWPFVTMNADRYGQVLAWIEIFRARVFSRIANPKTAQALGGDRASALDQLEAGVQFTLRENDGWLKFWLPSF
jgi:hypothetical protein